MQTKSILGLCAAAALLSAPLVHAAGGEKYGTDVEAQQGQTQQQGAWDQQAVQSERSEAVLQVQKKLNEEGYSAGPEDGILGEKTRSALSEFQKSEDMQASGEINRETLEALDLDPESAEFAAFVESEEDSDAGVQEDVGEDSMSSPEIQ